MREHTLAHRTIGCETGRLACLAWWWWQCRALIIVMGNSCSQSLVILPPFFLCVCACCVLRSFVPRVLNSSGSNSSRIEYFSHHNTTRRTAPTPEHRSTYPIRYATHARRRSTPCVSCCVVVSPARCGVVLLKRQIRVHSRIHHGKYARNATRASRSYTSLM